MVAVAREVFSVPEEVETRLWNKYTRDTFELLDKSESTLQVPVLIYLFDSCTVPFIRGVRIRIRGGSTLILVGWIRIRFQKGKNDPEK
jgi:hypothetical protein